MIIIRNPEQFRQDCRLLYHLTSTPVFCRTARGAPVFSYPHLEGLEHLNLTFHPTALDTASGDPDETAVLPLLSPEGLPCLYSLTVFQMETETKSTQDFQLLFGPSLLLPLTAKELIAVFPELADLDSRLLFRILSALPISEPEYFCDLLALACSLLFHVSIKPSRIWEANNRGEFGRIPAATETTMHHRRENTQFHTPYSYEKKMLDSLRSGNLSLVEETLNDLNLTGKPGILSTNPLRHNQNLFIAFITQVTRAAIDAGVAEEHAYALSDSYIMESEKCRDISGIAALRAKAAYDFTAAVAKCKGTQSFSPVVRLTISYFSRHLQEKITLTDAANAAGLSVSRLSHLFRQETGLSPMQYLNKERIETAKNMLTVFQYSISQISMILSYSSQSHFISVFKKYTGMTPKEYRDGRIRPPLI